MSEQSVKETKQNEETDEETNEETDEESKEVKKRLWEEQAELLQDMYDSMPEDMRVRQPKPIGYHKPDMDFPKKWQKPRDRKKKWKKGVI